MPRMPLLRCALLAMMTAACGDSAVGGRALDPTVRDSAGVRIVEHPAAVFEQDTVALGSPVLLIGASEGEGADVFGTIGGVVRLADGAVAGLDVQAAEVRVFGPDGSLRTRFGRAGGGPGEFERPAALYLLLGDTLAVQDRYGTRVHLFTSDGRVLGMERGEATGGARWSVAGAFTDGAWVVQSQSVMSGPPPDGRLDQWRSAGARARGAMEVDSLAYMRGGVTYFNSTEDGFTFWDVPLAPAGAVAPLGDGIAVHDGDLYAFRVIGRDGHLRSLVRIAVEPPPVTTADHDASIAERLSGMRESNREAAGRELAAIPREARHPGFGPLLANAVDRVWVTAALPTPAGAEPATQLLVFDDAGVLRGRVLLPRTERLGHLGATHLVTIGRDDLDVEQVRVYELPEALRGRSAR